MDTIPQDDPMENQAPLSGLDPADLLRQGVAEDTMLGHESHAFQPPPADELAPLFPQFEILGLIGKGGMGAVYKVRQKELDRIVALKILPPAIGKSPAFADRFAREAKALAKLNHPGIVTLHEFGQREGLYYILMEFVNGVNLATLMRGGRISPREALAIVPQICDALQFAHDHGIVHRDIKPENILLDRLGRVKVADFGIAKVVAAVCEDTIRSGDIPVPENQTMAGNIMGTPQYMAPEQIEHPADVDHRADIYALGVVFYQMLTGELPGKEMQVPSSKVRIDVRLDEIVMQALEKEPGLRYQQASLFKTRVETVSSDNGAAGVPPVSLVSDTSGQAGAETPSESRFSRTAIVGACWAPLFLVLFIATSSSVPVGAEPSGQAWWQHLLSFTLLPLGLTAPFGTTILGWIAVSQIRRAAGRLQGLWLAVFDGLLFPLLLMTGLIGWFWHWVFNVLIKASIIEGSPELSTVQLMFVNNTTAFSLLATVATSLVLCFLIVRSVWRAVSAGGSGTANQARGSKGSSIAKIGCGLLLLFGLLFGLVAAAFIAIFYARTDTSSPPDDSKVMLERQEGISAVGTNPPILDFSAQGRAAQYDWQALAAKGLLSVGEPVMLDGRSCLRIENIQDEPMQLTLLKIENPSVKEMKYEVSGEIRYENVAGQGYLETWNVFPEGRFFSRTNGEPGSGPLAQLSGTSSWRNFSLPFDRFGTKEAPTSIEVNLHLPGKGVVFIGPLGLFEITPDSAHGNPEDMSAPDIWKTVGTAAEQWLAKVDAGDYGQSWNDGSAFFRKSITEAAWADLLTKTRKPLGAPKNRLLTRRENTKPLPGAPDGEYIVMQWRTSFEAKENAAETLTLVKEPDGSWKASGYFVR